ncbi:MAG TPA: methylated-DNA--[protein]-cysteine S-methyltransferase [Acidimicrobiales bacterium]|nr:methylated-DNA--[protein]-cysteine S-methyltransferase [Acidimicrobiales bacterium]
MSLTRARTIDSPIGPITLAGDHDALTRVVMHEQCHAPGDQSYWPQDPNAFNDVVDQLTAYWEGDLRHFDLRLRIDGTAFQQRVWRALQEIPYGETWSYAELADHIGAHNAQRAVGSANGRNPIAIIVPCHRVIAANGTLGGYGGGLDRKHFLLALEGARHAAAEASLF